jgi:hypothetical protein
MKGFLLVPAGAAIAAVLASGATTATEQVTISAQPSVARWGFPVTVSGSVPSARADDIVTLEAKQCGRPPSIFRAIGTARTDERGAWSLTASPLSNAVLRASWRDAVSPEVTVQVRPSVQLSRRAGRGFHVRVWAAVAFRGKRVVIERYDRRVGTWATVRGVRLTEFVGASARAAKFRAAVPRRSLVRAVLPRSEARPCYLAGYSNLVRT